MNKKHKKTQRTTAHEKETNALHPPNPHKISLSSGLPLAETFAS